MTSMLSPAMSGRAVLRWTVTAGATVGVLLAGVGSAHADVPGQPREAVVAQYQQILMPALEVPADWTGSVDGCSPGATSANFEQATLAAVNYMRGLAGQPAVGLDAGMNARAQSAALIMAAQNALDHSPPSSWACWTQQGYDGAHTSNLALGNAGAAAIVAYMKDGGSTNTRVGHRRWILNSQATLIGTGSTNRSNALAVIGAPRGASNGAWLPWPTSGYFPWQMEPGGRWSLGLPGGSFDAAAVSMTVDGVPLPVTVNPAQYGYGDNTMSWEAQLPQRDYKRHPEDMNVDVIVSGIRLGDGRVIDYAYTVNLVDAAPHTAPSRAYFEDVRRTRDGILATWRPSVDDGGELVTYTVTATPIGRKNAKKYPVLGCETTQSACLLPKAVKNVDYRVVLVASNVIGSSAPDTDTSGTRR